jgi:PAT family beta-lactamase induction signal transducer AmpG
VGGGLGLVLAQQLPAPWMASCIVGALCMACAGALWLTPMPQGFARGHGVWAAIKATFRDFWAMMRQRRTLLALVLCILPLGTSAAPFSAIADEWRASADTVALVSGTLAGLVSAAGCLAGGWACDRMSRQGAYAWFGIFQAATCVAMALLPRTSVMYITWTMVYNFTAGLAYAAFSAFVLEAIGKGAAATKYNALACVSNVPIYYMTIVDGRAHDKWNSSGMFFTEAGLAVAAAVVFVGLAKVLWREKAVGVERQAV